MKLFRPQKNILLEADRLAFQNMLVRWAAEPGGKIYRVGTFSVFAFAALLVWYAICKALEGVFLLSPPLTGSLVGFFFLCVATNLSGREAIVAITKCYGGWSATLSIGYQERLAALKFLVLRSCMLINVLLGAIGTIIYLSISAYQSPRFIALWSGMILGGEFLGAFYSLMQIARRPSSKQFYSVDQKLMAGTSEMLISSNVVLNRRGLTLLEHRYAKWLGRRQCGLASGKHGFAMRVVYGALGLGGSALIDLSYNTHIATVISGVIFSHLIFMSICRVNPWVNPSISTSPIEFHNLLIASFKASMLISMGVYSFFVCTGLLVTNESYGLPLFGALAIVVFNSTFLLCVAICPGDRVKGNLIYMAVTLAVGGMFQVIGIFGIIATLLIEIYLYRAGSGRYVQP